MAVLPGMMGRKQSGARGCALRLWPATNQCTVEAKEKNAHQHGDPCVHVCTSPDDEHGHAPTRAGQPELKSRGTLGDRKGSS